MNNSKKVKSVKKAVIYTRVSTEEQAVRGNSLADQEELLRKACQYEGIEIVDHIQDDGYSAKTFNRPAFQQFLVSLKNGRIKADFL
jgi:site-specific DNA recombinase